MVEIGATKRKEDKHTPEYKQEFYAQLLGYAEIKNYKPGWASYKYEEKFAVRPHRRPEPAPPGSAVLGWLTSRNIRKSHSKGAHA